LPFATLHEILAPCQGQGWAVPGFDVLNQETVLAVLDGAAAERAPVILMVYPNHPPPDQWAGLVALMRTEAERIGTPVCLHLDHSKDLELVQRAIDAGFSSVMIDGSTLPLAENIALTRQAVAAAHACGISVEAELGHVGQGDEVLTAEQAAGRLTRPEEASQFVRETGVDALAIAIGTAHGLYRGTPKLDFDRLEALRQAVTVPLVLHGGSNTPDEDIQRAIIGGISKVNIWTEVALAFAGVLKEKLAAPVEQCRLPEAMAAARVAAQGVVQLKIHLLRASGRV
jgi:fructose-bisphosphate aldolase, class II